MNNIELSNHADVLALARRQEEMDATNKAFAERISLGLSHGSWGKIKGGNYPGNCEKALASVQAALRSLHENLRSAERFGEMLVLPHMIEASDAVELARRSRDEHRLVVVCGQPGAGKSQTGAYLAEQYRGTIVHARPSWSKSYLMMLRELGSGLGISGDWCACGKAERAIINALKTAPRLVIIDEANHFNADGLNFLKTIINETRSCLVLLTLPAHLSRISAESAEESRQLLRRSAAIVHIPAVDVEAVRELAGLKELEGIEGCVEIASLANKYHRLDTVGRVLAELAGNGGQLQLALKVVERQIQVVA